MKQSSIPNDYSPLSRNELEKGAVYILVGKKDKVNILLVATVSLWVSRASLAVKLADPAWLRN